MSNSAAKEALNQTNKCQFFATDANAKFPTTRPLAIAFQVNNCFWECRAGPLEGKVQIHRRFPLKFSTQVSGGAGRDSCVCSVDGVAKVRYKIRTAAEKKACKSNEGASAKDICWQEYLKGLSMAADVISSSKGKEAITFRRDLQTYQDSSFSADRAACISSVCQGQDCLEASFPQLTEHINPEAHAYLLKAMRDSDVRNPNSSDESAKALSDLVQMFVESDVATLIFTALDTDHNARLSLEELIHGFPEHSTERIKEITNSVKRPEDSMNLEKFGLFHRLLIAKWKLKGLRCESEELGEQMSVRDCEQGTHHKLDDVATAIEERLKEATA